MPAPSAADDPLIGQSIAGYDIVENLGAGGMGVVYRAIDRKLDRSVALKLLRASQPVGSAQYERFLREARAAAALDHPNIGTVYGVEQTPNGDLCCSQAIGNLRGCFGGMRR
jgi:serine/threonine-protein kinase